MFWHTMKYAFLCLIRDKDQVFWCFAFPLILGTVFSFAFGGLAEGEHFSPIPVAVVAENTDDANASASLIDSIFELFDSLSKPGEDQFLAVSYTTEEEALSLLEEKEIYGIITVNSSSAANAPLALTISSEMNSDPLYQSILSSFVEQFNMEYYAIADIAKAHPEQLGNVLKQMSEPTEYLTKEPLSAGSLDVSLTYYFNLIAMTCLYAAMAGSNIAIDNQANLTSLGARRNISPVHRFVSILGELSALLLFEFSTVVIALLYFGGVLHVDFGNHLGYIALTALFGCLTGISLGFFIGSIGRFSKETKFGFLMAVVMISCFLSGLMDGSMRIIVEETCPLINHISPAALISDALYALAVYPSNERFFLNITSLIALSTVFCLGGFVLIRRKKYASI